MKFAQFWVRRELVLFVRFPYIKPSDSHTRIHACTRMHTRMCMHMHTRMHTHTHTNTHTYTHTHTSSKWTKHGRKLPSTCIQNMPLKQAAKRVKTDSAFASTSVRMWSDEMFSACKLTCRAAKLQIRQDYTVIWVGHCVTADGWTLCHCCFVVMARITDVWETPHPEKTELSALLPVWNNHKMNCQLYS